MKVIYNGSADVKAFKDVFAKMIPQMIDDDPDCVYLDADLMSCIGVAKAAKTRTDRMINCGIAEANMVGIAAGLAAAGFKPICHSFAPFASRRCFDQAFMSAGYAHNDITIIGTDPGVCAAYNGGTHMPFEDMAMYRALPGATVVDETYAVNLSLPENMENRHEVMFGVAMLSWMYWAIATVCGCLIGNLIPWDMSGVDFCMTALFVIILMDQWEKAADKKPALIGGGIALIALAVFVGSSFMLPALLATSAVLLIPNRKGAKRA